MIKSLLLKKVLLLTVLVLLYSSLVPQSNSTGASTLENVLASEAIDQHIYFIFLF
ncbi:MULTISPECIES: hypothetical protein [Bacillus cereus group]|uniref:Uncharacterized protein n=1 Tax=Bacillus cereus VD021 TaxID=1053224 RepID=R8HF95_BACCE|nr:MULTISPECIES: hypothetical protein [Bacillus cereus group]EOO71548.1 hypothetical protein IIC_04321 [Bacillus cereus VD021]MCQ6569465.1 hypothetical protein [Bacillus mycoides]